MTFAQSSQQAKEFLCTLHRCAHFCFPYGKRKKKPKPTKLDHSVRGEKNPNKTTNQSTKPNQPPAVRDSVFATSPEKCSKLEWRLKRGGRGPPSTLGISQYLLEV